LFLVSSSQSSRSRWNSSLHSTHSLASLSLSLRCCKCAKGEAKGGDILWSGCRSLTQATLAWDATRAAASCVAVNMRALLGMK
jgi:hypothetical protein